VRARLVQTLPLFDQSAQTIIDHEISLGISKIGEDYVLFKKDRAKLLFVLATNPVTSQIHLLYITLYMMIFL